MATYQIKGPNGETYQIQGPDDADPSAVIAQVSGQHRFGSGKSFDATPGGVVPTGSPAAVAARSPISDSDTQNFLAGAGKGMTDLTRGAGQWLGLESRQDVANSRALDAPLMSTKAGKAGDFTGIAVPLLLTSRIPGANKMMGAAAIGAGTGLLMPSTSTGETLANTGLGAASGPLGLMAGRAVGSLYNAGKSALQPFLRGGPEQIASRTVQSFAGSPQEAAAAAHALTNPPQVLPGVQPTTAELANNPGLNQLERTLTNQPEFNTTLTRRLQGNQTAMTQAVRGLAGTDAQMTAAQQARTAASAPLYQAASDTVVPADAELGKLLARPSLKAAWSRAQELAAERGETLAEPNANDVSGRTLQYLKMALQDNASAGPQRGIGAHELSAVKSTLGDLQGWITKNVPALRQADSAYAAGSRPINQMQIGQSLRNQLEPALNDFSQAPNKLNAASFAKGVRGGDQLAADVTGNPRATLAGALEPDQVTALRQIGEQLARRGAVNDVGRAVGSNTAQNLIGQNFLQQTLGPLAIPQNAFGRVVRGVGDATLGRGYQWLARTAEPDVQQFLQRAALDPREAARLLRLQPNSRVGQLAWARQGLLGPLANTGAQTSLQGLMGSGNAAQQ